MPSQGEFTLFGRDVASLSRDELSALRRRIGMVFQDVRLLDHLSAFDNVALPLRINGGQDDQIGGFVSEMLVWLGLSGAIEAKPPNLSMGQRQLIAVARAVIVRPNLLLCDEPTSNLDSKLARRLMHLFTQLRKLGTTVVVCDPQRGPGRALSPSDPAPRRGPPEGAVPGARGDGRGGLSAARG